MVPTSLALIDQVQDEEGIVTCLDETRHGLEDGDFVTFAEVKGMEELNSCEPRKVIVKGPYTFAIGDTRSSGDYVSGGTFTQVKMPKLITFVSVIDNIKKNLLSLINDLEIAARITPDAGVLHH